MAFVESPLTNSNTNAFRGGNIGGTLRPYWANGAEFSLADPTQGNRQMGRPQLTSTTPTDCQLISPPQISPVLLLF
jgi:hypothetical protein